jgi:DNA-binding transcriptional LysR family regulator
MAWDDWRVFLAVARTGSHAGAGKALGVAATTIGRRLAALEAEVGARLFDRTPTGLVPTEAGRAVRGRAVRVEEELAAALRELGGADARVEGSLRVTAGDGFIHYVLVPRLGELRRRHPGLVLDLRADNRVVDLSRREADVAVRLARPTEASLVARRLGPMGFALYAAEAYLERRGAPRALGELAEHELVGFDAAFDHLPQVKWLARHAPGVRWTLRATTTTAQVLACAEGQGIALLPTFVEAREPRLRRVLPKVAGPVRDTFLVTHADLRTNARVAAFVTWMLEGDRGRA